MSILFACVWLHAAMGVSQTIGTGTGAIAGAVTDSTGAALPNVAIVVTGSALMGTRTTTSGRDGRYAVAGLRPGDYAMSFTLVGFAGERRDGVHVGLDFTATVHVVLRPATRQEDVTVTRDTPVVDTRSSALGTTFDAAALANLPGSRSMAAILAAAPAVYLTRFDVGGTGPAVGPYSAYGTFGYNRPMMEGMSVSGINPLGLSLDYGPFDEVSVGTGGHGVEWPSPGVQMQISTRSGGNRYGASFHADVEPRDWQSFNIDADQIGRGAAGSDAVPAREANRAWSYSDVNAGGGGFVRRDRLWWYGSVRHQHVATRLVNFPVQPYETRLTNYGGKLTGLVHKQHRLIAFGQSGTNDQPTRLDPFGQAGLTAATAIHLSDTSTADSHAWGGVWKGEWNAVVGDAWFLEARAGQFSATRHERPNGFVGPRTEDVTTLIVSGSGREWETSLRRDQLYGSVSYAPAGGAGRHVLEAGGEVTRLLTSETWWLGYPGDVLHVLRSQRPAEVYLLQTPSQAENGLWWFSGYASDTVRLHRLTLTFGGRFDRHRAYWPAQAHPAGRFNPAPQTFAAVDDVIDWNVFAPRLGLVFDVFGDSRTLLKLSAGQYWLPPATEVGANSNPNANQWWRRYSWFDANGSGEWEPGEEGALLGARGGTNVESLDPGLRLPYVREVTAYFEREMRPGAVLRTGVVWRGERRQYQRENQNLAPGDYSVPVLVPDPGPDGLLSTDDDGASVQVWQLTPEPVGLPIQNILRNTAHSASDYWTWELGFTVRGHRRWSMTTGLVHTWTREQANAYLGQTVRQHTYALIPNDFINADDDGRHAFRMWSVKAFGTYAGPWDLRVTPLLRHQSGQPFGRTFATPLNYSRTVRILAEAIGTRRMDHITQVDVRVEKGGRLRGTGRLAVFLDVFNLFNANPEQTVSWASGTFLQPLSIVSPRIARIGVKFDW